MLDESENVVVVNEKYRENVYEKLWVIPDWIRVQECKDLLRTTKFEFETGSLTPNQTRWIIGFQKNYAEDTFHIVWKLVEARGFKDGKVQATISTMQLEKDSTTNWTNTRGKLIEVNWKIVVDVGLPFNCKKWKHSVNTSGEMVFKLRLTILEPEINKLDEFNQTSVSEVGKNFARLLNDQKTSDLKIVTSDGKKLLTHILILKAQCPVQVFDSMFRSKLSENQTGVVNMKDISGKTMGIFLHYFYSGELLPSWSDSDTVVEFTYAAGKYQVTKILELLDEVLASWNEEDATHTDIRLLELAGKLGLKTAENKLFEKVVGTTTKLNGREELFALYGIGGHKSANREN